MGNNRIEYEEKKEADKESLSLGIILTLFCTVIVLGILFWLHKSKHELIYGGFSVIFGVIGIIISLNSFKVSQKSIDIAIKSARAADRSADAAEKSVVIAEDAKDGAKLSYAATLDSIEIAKQEAETSKEAYEVAKKDSYTAKEALILAMREAEQARERYRADKGSLLIIQKNEMYIPLFAPGSLDQVHSIDNGESILNYTKIVLKNRGFGTAKNINLQIEFINAYLFDNYTYGTDTIKESGSLHQQNLMKELYPTYWIHSKLNDRNTSIPKILVKCGDQRGTYDISFEANDISNNRNLTTYTKNIPLSISKRLGFFHLEDQFSFYLPNNYQVLAHHFFLERLMEKKTNKRHAPNPILRIRVDYIDEVLEHLNDSIGAKRVKVFEITCSEDVTLVEEPEDSPHQTLKGTMMSCFFDINVVYDLPLIEAEQMEIKERDSRSKKESLFKSNETLKTMRQKKK